MQGALPRLHVVLVVGGDVNVDVVSATRMLCRLLQCHHAPTTAVHDKNKNTSNTTTTHDEHDATTVATATATMTRASMTARSVEDVLAYMAEVRRALAVRSGAVEFDVSMTSSSCGGISGGSCNDTTTTAATATTTTTPNTTARMDNITTPSPQGNNNNNNNNNSGGSSSQHARGSSSATRKSTTTTMTNGTAAAAAAAEAEAAAAAALLLEQQRQAYLHTYLPPHECVCVRAGDDAHATPVLFVYALHGQAQLLGGDGAGNNGGTAAAATTTTARASAAAAAAASSSSMQQTTAADGVSAMDCAAAFVHTVTQAWHEYTQQQQQEHASSNATDTDIVVVWAVTDVRLLSALSLLSLPPSSTWRTRVAAGGDVGGDHNTAANTTTTTAATTATTATRTASRAGGRPHSAASQLDATTAAATKDGTSTTATATARLVTRDGDGDGDEAANSHGGVMTTAAAEAAAVAWRDALARCCADVRVLVRLCTSSSRSSSGSTAGGGGSNSSSSGNAAREQSGGAAAEDNSRGGGGARRVGGARKGTAAAAMTSSSNANSNNNNSAAGARTGNKTDGGGSGHAAAAAANDAGGASPTRRPATSTPSSSSTGATPTTAAAVYDKCTSVAQLLDRVQQLSRQYSVKLRQRQTALPPWADATYDEYNAAAACLSAYMTSATSSADGVAAAAAAAAMSCTTQQQQQQQQQQQHRYIGTPVDVYLLEQYAADVYTAGPTATNATTTTTAAAMTAAQPVWAMLDVAVDMTSASARTDAQACRMHVLPTLSALVACTAAYSAWRRTRVCASLPLSAPLSSLRWPRRRHSDAAAATWLPRDDVCVRGRSLMALAHDVQQQQQRSWSSPQMCSGSLVACDMRHYARVRRAAATALSSLSSSSSSSCSLPQHTAAAVVWGLLAQAAVDVARAQPMLLLHCRVDTTDAHARTSRDAATDSDKDEHTHTLEDDAAAQSSLLPLRTYAETTMYDDGRGTCSVLPRQQTQQQQQQQQQQRAAVSSATHMRGVVSWSAGTHRDSSGSSNSALVASVVTTATADGGGDDKDEGGVVAGSSSISSNNNNMAAAATSVARGTTALTSILQHTQAQPAHTHEARYEQQQQRRRACVVTSVRTCHHNNNNNDDGKDEDVARVRAQLEATLQHCVDDAMGVYTPRHTTATTRKSTRQRAHDDTSRRYVAAVVHTLCADEVPQSGAPTSTTPMMTTTVTSTASATATALTATRARDAVQPPLPQSQLLPPPPTTTTTTTTTTITSERVRAFVLHRSLLDTLAVLAGVAPPPPPPQRVKEGVTMSGNTQTSTRTTAAVQSSHTQPRRLPVRCAEEVMTATAMHTRIRAFCERYGLHMCNVWRCLYSEQMCDNNNNNNAMTTATSRWLWVAGLRTTGGRSQRRVWLHSVSGVPSLTLYTQWQRWLQQQEQQQPTQHESSNDKEDGGSDACNDAEGNKSDSSSHHHVDDDGARGLPSGVMRRLLRGVLARRDCVLPLRPPRCDTRDDDNHTSSSSSSSNTSSSHNNNSSTHTHHALHKDDDKDDDDVVVSDDDAARADRLLLLAEGRHTLLPHTDALIEVATTRCSRSCSIVAADEVTATLHYALPCNLLRASQPYAHADADGKGKAIGAKMTAVTSATTMTASAAATAPCIHLAVRYDDGVLLTCAPQCLPAAALVAAATTCGGNTTTMTTPRTRAAVLPPISAGGDVRLCSDAHTRCVLPLLTSSSSSSSSSVATAAMQEDNSGSDNNNKNASGRASSRSSRAGALTTTSSAAAPMATAASSVAQKAHAHESSSSHCHASDAVCAAIPRTALTVTSAHCAVHTREDDDVVWLVYNNNNISSNSSSSLSCTPASLRPGVERVHAVHDYAAAASQLSSSLECERARGVCTRSGVVTRFFDSRRVVLWQKLYPTGAVCTRVLLRAATAAATTGTRAARTLMYCDTLTLSSGACYVRRLCAVCAREATATRMVTAAAVASRSAAEDAHTACTRFVRIARAPSTLCGDDGALSQSPPCACCYDACADCDLVSRADGVRVATYYARYAHAHDTDTRCTDNDNDNKRRRGASPVLRVAVHADGTSIATLLPLRNDDAHNTTSTTATTTTTRAAAAAAAAKARSSSSSSAYVVRSATASALLHEAATVGEACAHSAVRFVVESPYTPRVFACQDTHTRATTTTTTTTATAAVSPGGDDRCGAYYIVFADGSVLKRHRTTVPTTTTSPDDDDDANRHHRGGGGGDEARTACSGVATRVLRTVFARRTGTVARVLHECGLVVLERAAAARVCRRSAAALAVGRGFVTVDVAGGGVRLVDDALYVTEVSRLYGGAATRASSSSSASLTTRSASDETVLQADVCATMQPYTWEQLLRQLVRPSYTTHRQSRAQLARLAQHARDTAATTATATTMTRQPPTLLTRLRRLAEPIVTAHELLRPDILHSLTAAAPRASTATLRSRHDSVDDDDKGGDDEVGDDKDVMYGVAPLYFVAYNNNSNNNNSKEEATATAAADVVQLVCGDVVRRLRHAARDAAASSQTLASAVHRDSAVYVTDTAAAGDALVRQLTLYDSGGGSDDVDDGAHGATAQTAEGAATAAALAATSALSYFHCGSHAAVGMCDVQHDETAAGGEGQGRRLLQQQQRQGKVQDAEGDCDRRGTAALCVTQPTRPTTLQQQQVLLARASGAQWLPPTLQPAPRFDLHQRMRTPSAAVVVHTQQEETVWSATTRSRVCRVLLEYADTVALSAPRARALLQCEWHRLHARYEAARASATLTYNSHNSSSKQGDGRVRAHKSRAPHMPAAATDALQHIALALQLLRLSCQHIMQTQP